MITEKAMSLGACKVDEVLDRWIVGVRDNAVRDPGAVGEDRAGAEGNCLFTDCQDAFATGYKLQRVEGEISTIDLVVRPAVLTAATDDDQRLGLVTIGVQIESVGLMHLA